MNLRMSCLLPMNCRTNFTTSIRPKKLVLANRNLPIVYQSIKISRFLRVSVLNRDIFTWRSSPKTDLFVLLLISACRCLYRIICLPTSILEWPSKVLLSTAVESSRNAASSRYLWDATGHAGVLTAFKLAVSRCVKMFQMCRISAAERLDAERRVSRHTSSALIKLVLAMEVSLETSWNYKLSFQDFANGWQQKSLIVNPFR